MNATPSAAEPGQATCPPSRMANAIRALAMDAVQKANSGHPGAPMGMADMAVALWSRHLRHNPANPGWSDRDRFVLSNGHASMLLYALLHLTGYDLPIEELKRFRQLHSRTPGHPEVGLTPGVETTTGPLGQGIANAVGMALAERLMAARFNRPGLSLVDHHTFCFVGDGCLMEGISHEACSLAGTLGLSRLIVLYDDNGISIDGKVEHWFRDDTTRRFEAYGWNVIAGIDGHDIDAVDAAIRLAKSSDRPSLLVCRTTIGKGAPTRAGTAKAHGEPLGEAEIGATRAQLGWSAGPFEIDESVYAAWNARETGRGVESQWRATFNQYREKYPELAAEFERRMAGNLPADWAARAASVLARVSAEAGTVATRKASQIVLTELVRELPEMIGGSADLTGSNLTDWKDAVPVRADSLARGEAGRHINYGVREFGMAAVMNGMALHGGLLPFGGTFLTFSDYSRNAIRMAALMKQRVVHVFTHDSIGLGEDGPTHQPVEHVTSLRIIPNLDVWRPCDTAETATAWLSAVSRRDGPSALVLSRQNLPAITRDATTQAAMARGGYVLRDAPDARAVLVATGSEVTIALQAADSLAATGRPVRVVSMPSTTVFDRQDREYRDAVLPRELPVVAVEAGVTDFWCKYVGRDGEVIGIDTFGESAPAPALYQHFGITPAAVAEAVGRVVG